jgi:type I restriction enzyme S subunit
VTWPTASIADVVEGAKPGFACGANPTDGVFQVRMNNVTTAGSLDLSKKRRVPTTTRKLESYLLRRGDVLFNSTNSPKLVGKSAFFPGVDEQAVFSNHFVRLRPTQRIDGRFLARWLTLQFQAGLFEGMCRQWVNQATVGTDSLLKLSVPLPPLAEQHRIANMLDQADALRSKRRAALTQLDTLTQSIFLDMFEADGSHRSACTTARLGDLCSSITDGVHQTPRYVPVGVPFVTVKNMVTGRLDLTNTKFISAEDHRTFTRRTRPECGDVLVSKDGTIGASCPVLTDRDFSVFVSVALLKPRAELIEQTFLTAQFRSPMIQRQIVANSKGIAIRHLHLEDFKRLEFVVPTLEAQRTMGQRLDAVTTVRATHETSLHHLDALFGALQHRAFRGEL